MNGRVGQSASSGGTVRALAVGFAILIGIVSAALLLGSQFVEALFVLGFGIIVAALAGDVLVGLTTLFVVVAVYLNSAGYLFDLWKDPQWFDEVVHFATGVAAVFSVAWVSICLAGLRMRRLLLFPFLVGSGLTLALLWEAVEWLAGMIDSAADTVVDVTLATAGGLLAALLSTFVRDRHRISPVRLLPQTSTTDSAGSGA